MASKNKHTPPVPGIQEPVPAAGDDLMLPVDEFWEEHKAKIVGGVLLLLVVAAVFVGNIIWQHQQKVAAEELLATARSPDAWRQVMSSHPNTPAAGNAALLLAAAVREAGDLEASDAIYQNLLASNEKYPLQAAAALGLAENLQSVPGGGDTAQVRSALQLVATGFPGTYVAPYALYSEGEMLQRNGRDQEAMVAFRALLADYPQSLLVPMAGMQLQQLSTRSEDPLPEPGEPDLPTLEEIISPEQQ